MDGEDLGDMRCSFVEEARRDADGHSACCVCSKLRPAFASTNNHPLGVRLSVRAALSRHAKACVLAMAAAPTTTTALAVAARAA
jgi:hypothetical protein